MTKAESIKKDKKGGKQKERDSNRKWTKNKRRKNKKKSTNNKEKKTMRKTSARSTGARMKDKAACEGLESGLGAAHATQRPGAAVTDALVQGAATVTAPGQHRPGTTEG